MEACAAYKVQHNIPDEFLHQPQGQNDITIKRMYRIN